MNRKSTQWLSHHCRVGRTDRNCNKNELYVLGGHLRHCSAKFLLPYIALTTSSSALFSASSYLIVFLWPPTLEGYFSIAPILWSIVDNAGQKSVQHSSTSAPSLQNCTTHQYYIHASMDMLTTYADRDHTHCICFFVFFYNVEHNVTY